MKQLWLFTIRCSSASALPFIVTLGLAAGFPVHAQEPKPESSAPAPVAQLTASANVMRDYKGVKLGMKRDEVRAMMGKTELKEKDKDRFIINGDDRLTVYYDNDQAKAIQLYIVDAKNAPAWTKVVGDAEIVPMANGARHARREVREEQFWVSMYQSKDGSLTTITISR